MISRTAWRVSSLILTAVLIVAVDPAPVAADPGSAAVAVAEPQSLSTSSSYPAALNDKISSFDKRMAERSSRQAGIKPRQAELDRRTEAYNKQSKELVAQLDSVKQRIAAHNAEADQYPNGAPPATANALNARARALNTELQQVKSALLALANEGDAIKARQKELDDLEASLDDERGDLLDERQDLIGQAASTLVTQLLGQAAAAAYGGDAPRPAGQLVGGSAASGGDTPRSSARVDALDQYARTSGLKVDKRPVVVVLSKEAVSRISAGEAGALQPSLTFAGLARKRDGTYVALYVADPRQEPTAERRTFNQAINRGGGRARVDGEEVDITETAPVDGPSQPEPTPSPSSSSNATCLTSRPAKAVGSGSGWILNTSESVEHRNKTTNPKGASYTRATQARACLTNPHRTGKEAGGDIAGWQDAQIFAGKNAPDARLARCHLIAAVVGGRGNKANLVPCWQVGMNTGTPSMRTPYETDVQHAVDQLGARDAVLYEVTPNYRDDTSTIPESVTMSATVERANGTNQPMFSGVIIRNDMMVGGAVLNLGN